MGASWQNFKHWGKSFSWAFLLDASLRPF